jgi:hypothetical protein
VIDRKGRHLTATQIDAAYARAIKKIQNMSTAEVRRHLNSTTSGRLFIQEVSRKAKPAGKKQRAA